MAPRHGGQEVAEAHLPIRLGCKAEPVRPTPSSKARIWVEGTPSGEVSRRQGCRCGS